MIRFTSGSVFKVISLCKTGRQFSDDKIADMLFPETYTTNYIAHVKNCTKNLPLEIIDYMKDNDAGEIFESLHNNVISVYYKAISTQQQPYLIAAIQEILQNDTFISESAQIGYDSKYTKEYIISASYVNPIEFLTNILFCICNQLNNPDGRDGIKDLDKTYISNLRLRAEHLVLLTYNKTSSFNANKNVYLPSLAGDDYQIVYETPEGEQIVAIYEKFSHSWRLKNTGIVEWVNRFITLKNKSNARVKPIEAQITIPDLKPGEDATVTANLDARYFEGSHTLIWEIQTEDGVSCFPNKDKDISFTVTVKNNI